MLVQKLVAGKDKSRAIVGVISPEDLKVLAASGKPLALRIDALAGSAKVGITAPQQLKISRE